MKLMSNTAFSCQYCGAKFVQERTLAIHVCEQKRRHLAKDEKHVLIGYQTYIQFYKFTQNAKHTKTYDEFAKSPYYNAFIKFGSFVSNTDPLYPEKFIEFVVKSGVKLDHWCRDELYEKYVINLIHTENVETALERSISHMQNWAESNNSLWNHYFKYASTSRAIFDIKDGKVSPWLILNSKTGREMMAEFKDEQLASIGNIIDPQIWIKKFKSLPADVALVKEVVKTSGL